MNGDSWTANYSNGSQSTVHAPTQTNAIGQATVHANHNGTNLTHIQPNRR